MCHMSSMDRSFKAYQLAPFGRRVQIQIPPMPLHCAKGISDVLPSDVLPARRKWLRLYAPQHPTRDLAQVRHRLSKSTRHHPLYVASCGTRQVAYIAKGMSAVFRDVEPHAPSLVLHPPRPLER